MDRSTFHSFSPDYYATESSGSQTGSSNAEFSFWPPVRKQRLISETDPARITLVTVSAPNDQLLLTLGTTTVLDEFLMLGLEVNIGSDADDANCIIEIDGQMCPTANSYEIQVGKGKVLIVAADNSGALYALHTLVQFAVVHGVVERDGDDRPVLVLPAMTICDSPAVGERAVMASAKHLLGAGTGPDAQRRTADYVALLSRLRVTALYLVVGSPEDNAIEAGDSEEEEAQNSSSFIEANMPELLEACAMHFITVVPTFVFISILQKFPVHILRSFKGGLSNFNLVVSMDQKDVAMDVVCEAAGHRRRVSVSTAATQSVTASTAEAKCSAACRKVLEEAFAAGFTRITLSYSDWVATMNLSHVAEICAEAAGVRPEGAQQASVRVLPLGVMYPTQLMAKPVLCIQDFVQTVRMYIAAAIAAAAAEADGRVGLAMLPCFSQSDSLRPALLSNLYMSLYAGAAWSRSPVVEQWGSLAQLPSQSRASSVSSARGNNATSKAATWRAVFATILFPNTFTAPPEVPTTGAAAGAVTSTTVMAPTASSKFRTAVLSIVTGEAAGAILHTLSVDSSSSSGGAGGGGSGGSGGSAGRGGVGGSGGGAAAGGGGDSALSGAGGDGGGSGQAGKLTLTDFARAEKMLWSLLIAYDDLSFNALPQKNEAALCVRLYRRLLQVSQWRPAALPAVRQGTGYSTGAGAGAGAGAVALAGSERAACDELFSLLNMLSVLSRVVFLSSAGLAEGHELSSLMSFNVATVVGASSSAASGAAALAGGGAAEMQAGVAAKRVAVYDQVDLSQPYQPKIHPKTAKTTELLMKVVQQNLLFRNYSADQHGAIVQGFEPVQTVAGEVVIQQGDLGEYFYIVESGRADIYMESAGFKIKVGRALKSGDYFGELALMYNTPRAATVVSTEACRLWRIDRQTYRTIVTQHSRQTAAEFQDLLSNVEILGKRIGDVFTQRDVSKLVSLLEVEEFSDGAVIVRQFLTGDYFYIIAEGQVDVWQLKQDGTGSTSRASTPSPTPSPCSSKRGSERDSGTNESLMGKKVAELARGDYFGEKALLADDVRQASCVAVGRVVCLSLSREDFIAMFGNWSEASAAAAAEKSREEEQAVVLANEAAATSRKGKLSVSLSELEVIRTLGIGAFGRVSLVRHSDTGSEYALKAQSKSFITAQGMQQMLLSEMRIMSMVDHPSIAKLYCALQDSKYVYFVLELLPGGEFFNYLQIAGKLSEDSARFYSASVVSAFGELHKHKIAYRDLKPENMVLNGKGYVKLVDLGLAKQITSGSTWTMCGTPDYLAPEIVLNKGHDFAVDYWALGVLIYEMIHGWPPFYHDDQMKVYAKIVSGKVSYPDSFSSSLEDLVGKLLTKVPSKRLGNMKGGVADIVKHKWFGPFDWAGLAKGKLRAPYNPPPMGSEDNSQSEEEEEGPDANAEESDWVIDLL